MVRCRRNDEEGWGQIHPSLAQATKLESALAARVCVYSRGTVYTPLRFLSPGTSETPGCLVLFCV